MIELNIQTNLKDITASLNRLAADLENKALVRALNKTAVQARTEASREVRAVGFNIKASAIKASFKIQRANASSLVVVLTATGKQIAMINYGARQTKSGVSVQIKNGRTILKHAFIRTMKSGHTGVFERIGAARIKGNKRAVAGRVQRVNTPIRELFGPSIPSSLANDAVRAAIMRKIREKFPKILEHELQFIAMKK